MKNTIITDEFREFLNIAENTNQSIFLTGKAGTGKSTVIKEFIAETGKNVVVLAPTGIAAVNAGGQTIHSFFRLKNNRQSVKFDKERHELYKAIDTIIIDEISMVRADIMDAIDETLRINRECENIPFGGVQIIFVGDLFQLPPVVTNQDREYINSTYKSEYFFDAKCMLNYRYKFIELTTIFRQSNSDDDFKNILNNIRVNSKDLNLDLLNTRYSQNANNGVYLTSRKEVAEKLNVERLKELNGESYYFNASISGAFASTQAPAPENLELKTGAKVMLLNNDKDGRWCNGTMGGITLITDNTIYVLVVGKNNTETLQVDRYSWKKYEFEWSEKQEKIIAVPTGEFCQFPMKLAYAITIHKSQGQTFDNVVIDIANGAFAHGQIYVALSRCRTLEGVTLKQRIRKQDIIVDKRIIEYYEEIRICKR